MPENTSFFSFNYDLVKLSLIGPSFDIFCFNNKNFYHRVTYNEKLHSKGETFFSKLLTDTMLFIISADLDVACPETSDE